VAKLTSNEYMTNASTFHSLHAISKQVRDRPFIRFHGSIHPEAAFFERYFCQLSPLCARLCDNSMQVAPVASGGIMSIDASTFSLYALEAPTGVKFFLTGRPKMDATANAFLARVYEAYADYVLKVSGDALVGCKAVRRMPLLHCSTSITPARVSPQNPFYEADQPIRIKFFDAALERGLRDLGLAAG